MFYRRAPVIASMGDSGKEHTGFGNVHHQIDLGFHKAGFIVNQLGFLDSEPDTEGKLPYTFFSTPKLDQLAHRTFSHFLRKVKPDLIFMICEPGNLEIYLKDIIERGVADYHKPGLDGFFRPPIISYSPIEGKPMLASHGVALEYVQATGGQVTVYHQSAYQTVKEQFPQIDPIVVNHGLDHANFRPYEPEIRQRMRQAVGLDDYFVIGSVGVNKRTKNYPAIIEVAAILRDMGEDAGIKFYCHTNPKDDTMWGYKLIDLAKYYGVYDMFLWKTPIRGKYWQGSERELDTVEKVLQLLEKGIKDDPRIRGMLWQSYDFVTMMNCFDLYLDVSMLEGWGLPMGEAMMCGVPVVTLQDHSSRDEVYKGGCCVVPSLPRRMWTTVHTGAKLAIADPNDFVNAILKIKEDPELRLAYANAGREVASKYKWANAQDTFCNIVHQVIERDEVLRNELLMEQDNV